MIEDFNALLSNEQVELLRAQAASTKAERRLHRSEAMGFARQIERHAFPYRSPDASGHRLFDAHSYDDAPVGETAH